MPFQPGQSGNPGGNLNKRTRLIGDTLRRAAAQNPEALRDGADKVVEMARQGDLAAWTYLRDTLDGKPAQIIAGDADNPVVVEEIIRRVVKSDGP